MSTTTVSTTDPHAILVDVTRCTGCERCVQACVEANDRDPRLADRDAAVAYKGLSAHRLCTVVSLDEGRWARKSCMHCLEPSCVAACLVGGLQKTPEGPVLYDADKCIGCRYCMLACPLHVPRYEWNDPLPFMVKCDMCHDRVADGRRPACVEACPHEALSFGRRSELLETAHRRIENEPGRYLPNVWGETEWGGTSVLYISDVDLAEVGLTREAARSVPSITDPVIHSTPKLGLGVAATMVGLSWIINRRQKLMNGEDGTEGEGGDRE